MSRVPARRPGEVSLARALSKLGVASRREAEEWIRAGRVSIAGVVCLDPARPVVPERAAIEVDDARALAVRWRTLLFHKPAGCVTTRRDPEGRATVFDRLGAAGKGLLAVGRLDLDTSGLLLLTSDSRLSDWLTDPRNAIPRRYLAVVEGEPSDAALARLGSGIEDRGERLVAKSVARVADEGASACLEIVLTEGKNREVRRLCAAIGHPVVRLERTAFGALELGDLASGEWRELLPAELRGAFGAGAPIGRGPVRARRSGGLPTDFSRGA